MEDGKLTFVSEVWCRYGLQLLDVEVVQSNAGVHLGVYERLSKYYVYEAYNMGSKLYKAVLECLE